MNLYLVQSVTGDHANYVDYEVIPLAIFFTEQEAQIHITELEEAYSTWDHPDFDYTQQPYAIYVDYNGPEFFHSVIPFKSPDVISTITNHHPELFI